VSRSQLTRIAALAGAGPGLVFAERRAAAQDRELESPARRVTTLERPNERVTRLEAGSSSPGDRGPVGLTQAARSNLAQNEATSCPAILTCAPDADLAQARRAALCLPNLRGARAAIGSGADEDGADPVGEQLSPTSRSLRRP
jgi:hypothetical protein